jgi:hypothetical protein
MNWCESVIVEEEVTSALESPMWSDIRGSLSFHMPILVFDSRKRRQCTFSEIL